MKKLIKSIFFLLSIILLSSCKNDVYLISFETDGGTSIETIKFDGEGSFVMPEDPMKNYQTFSGWYIDETFTNSFDMESDISSDLILYAKWDDVTITFESNGGSSIEPMIINSTTGFDLPDNPVKPYLEFAGWYKDASYLNVFSEDEMISSDMTLYAKWDEIIIYFETGDEEFMTSWNYSEHNDFFMVYRPLKPYYFFQGYEINGIPFTSLDQLTNGATLVATYEYFLDAIRGERYGDEFFGMNGFVSEYLFETNQLIDAYGNHVENENAIEPYEPFETFIESIGGYEFFTEELFISFIAEDIKSNSPSYYRNLDTDEMTYKEDFDETNVRYMDTNKRTFYYDPSSETFYLKRAIDYIDEPIYDYVEVDFFTAQVNQDHTVSSDDGLILITKTDKIKRLNNHYYLEVIYDNQVAHVDLNTYQISFFMPSIMHIINTKGIFIENNGTFYDYYEGGMFYQGEYTPYETTPFVDMFRKSVYNDFGLNLMSNQFKFIKLLVLITEEINPETYRNTNDYQVFEAHYPLIDLFLQDPHSLEYFGLYKTPIIMN